MKKILILGSEGYLGSVLIPYLSKNKYQIVGVDQCFFGKNNKSNKKIKIIKKNYFNLTKNFLKKFDYIIDLINISNDPASELNKKFTYKVNYSDKIKLYNKLISSKILKRYIYMSSCSVYGNNKKLITEKSIPKPISVYSKLCLKYEKYLKSTKKIPYTILRLGTLYGWSKRMRYDIAINKILRDMIFLKKVEVLGGTQLRFFCYNKFACKVIDSIVKETDKKYKNKTFNVGVFNTNIIKLVKKSIHETFLKIKKDKNPFDKKKITLNIYKNYLAKKNDTIL